MLFKNFFSNPGATKRRPDDYIVLLALVSGKILNRFERPLNVL